jgi:glucan 1,3-beta-glucosidase
VRNFGAVGDGTTDDSAAINAAMFQGPRCVGQNGPIAPCESSTVTTAIIYFPPGKYLIASRIIMPYNSIVIGDALHMPSIIGAPGFSDLGLLDSDPYYPGGVSWYANQNNFFRQVRNFVLDTTRMPMGFGNGIHWQVAQATSLQNIVFKMVEGGGDANGQQGIFMENGSGGFMRDLVFHGGGIAFSLGYVEWLFCQHNRLIYVATNNSQVQTSHFTIVAQLSK